MSEDDRYRIEPRLRGMQRGIGPQPEDIDLLRERQKEADKLSAPAPKRPFDSYLVNSADEESQPQENSSDAQDEQSTQAHEDTDVPERTQPAQKTSEPPPSLQTSLGRDQQRHHAQMLQRQLEERLAERQKAASAPRPSFFERKKPT